MPDKNRLLFIDLLRGFAIVIMIEVHVFNSLIMPEIKEEAWFSVLNFFNGLIAPSFLFISGFAFIISTQKNPFELRKFDGKFWKKLSRILLILVVGYSLHIPFFSIKRLITQSTPEQLLGFYNVDVLQNIAVGLLLLFALRVIITSNKFLYYFIIVLTFLIVFASPFIWSVDFAHYLPLPIAAYFNPYHGSYFPLFPWTGFLLAGAVHAFLYSRARESNDEKRIIKLTFLLGLLMIAIGHFYLSDIFPASYRSARPHPVFFFQRLGYVYIFLCLCWFYINSIAIPNKGISYIISTGRESLLIYWLHLQIIYRKVWDDKSLESVVGQSFNVLECIGATILLIILMAVTARVWGNYKQKHKKAASITTAVILGSAVLIFFLNIEIFT